MSGLKVIANHEFAVVFPEFRRPRERLESRELLTRFKDQLSIVSQGNGPGHSCQEPFPFEVPFLDSYGRGPVTAGANVAEGLLNHERP